eukprot:g61253.t1
MGCELCKEEIEIDVCKEENVADKTLSLPLVDAMEGLMDQLTGPGADMYVSKLRIDLPVDCSMSHAAMLIAGELYLSRLYDWKYALPLEGAQKLSDKGLFEILPKPVLLHIFSFVSIAEHVRTLPLLSWQSLRLTRCRSAWPSEIVIEENAKGGVCLGGSSSPPCPPLILDNLLHWRQFDSFRGVTAKFLHLYGSLLVSVPTRRLECVGLDISVESEALRKLGQLDGLQQLELRECKGQSDRGLAALRGLKLLSLVISAGNTSLSGATHTALEGMPLKMLKISALGFTREQALCDILPTGLPLTDFELVLREGVLGGDDLECLTDCPLRRLWLPPFPGKLQALSGMPVQELGLIERTLTAEDVSILITLPLRKLHLSSCGNLTGEVMSSLSFGLLYLEELGVFKSTITDATLIGLNGRALRRLRLVACTGVTFQGLFALCDRCAWLEELDLSKSDVTDAALPALRGLRRLTCLKLRDCGQLTDDGVNAALSEVAELTIRGTPHRTDSIEESMSTVRHPQAERLAHTVFTADIQTAKLFSDFTIHHNQSFRETCPILAELVLKGTTKTFSLSLKFELNIHRGICVCMGFLFRFFAVVVFGAARLGSQYTVNSTAESSSVQTGSSD